MFQLQPAKPIKVNSNSSKLQRSGWTMNPLGLPSGARYYGLLTTKPDGISAVPLPLVPS